MPRPLRRIAILVESSRSSGRRLIEGISSFASKRNDWLLYYCEGTLDIHLSEWLSKWSGDGIIMRISNETQAKAITTSGIPTVDLLGCVKHSNICKIYTDHTAVTKLGTDFFIRAGFTEFAFCGYPGVSFSDERQATFEKVVKVLGGRFFCYQSEEPKPKSIWAREPWHSSREKDLIKWLENLPKPMAILACNDIRALQIASACRLSGIKVPEEIIILGIDNDELICGMSIPAISSIEPDFIRQGVRGAEVLQEMINKGDSAIISESIVPKRIVERPSTDLLIFKTPYVAAAARIIRKLGYKEMSPEQLALAVGVSRSLLDRGFLNEVGHSVSKEIARVRLDRVRQLLRFTDYTLDHIADDVGFSGDASLAKFFKSATGENPTHYRATYSSLDH